jgi:hypothetical protein
MLMTPQLSEAPLQRRSRVTIHENGTLCYHLQCGRGRSPEIASCPSWPLFEEPYPAELLMLRICVRKSRQVLYCALPLHTSPASTI